MTMPPSEPALPIDNVSQLLANALVDAGIVGIDESIEQPVLNRAFTQVNWLLATWARKRWLVYRIQDYSFVSTGAQTYSVGAGATVNINPRPDRLEYAFMRFLTQGSSSTTAGGDFNADFSSDFSGGGSQGASQGSVGGGGFPVDIPLEIITSHEDYARIPVKTIGSFAWRIFYDPIWPVGLLFPWPIPQATIYEIHVGFKVVLPRFQSLQQKINFPPEYENALNWCLARRLRATYQMPADPTIDSLARDGLNTIRLANVAVPELVLPVQLRNRRRAYNPYGDN